MITKLKITKEARLCTIDISDACDKRRDYYTSIMAKELIKNLHYEKKEKEN